MAEAHWHIDPPCSPACLAELRHWAVSWLQRHAVSIREPNDVVLALTELVTNSIQHTSGPVDVSLSWDGLRLRAGVTDCSSALPHWPPAERRVEGGRGLLILDQLASRWGLTEHAPGGKTVWCEFMAAGPPN